MIPVAILLLVATTHVELVDEVYRIPAGQWRYVELGLRQRPAFVAANFEVQSGSHQVRLALLRRDDLERLRSEEPAGVLAATDPGASGKLRVQVRTPGEYAVVLDNRGDSEHEAVAHLRVSLDFGRNPGPAVSRLSPLRQILVVAFSFAVFFGIAGYSARRLLRGIRR